MDNYEMKYNEALSQARFYYGNCPTEPEKKKLEKIFPELRESEDEKIRKELLSFIESVQHSYLCATDRREKWIAYLKKQKEHHIPWYDFKKSKEAGYTIVPNEEYKQLIKQKEQNEESSKPELKTPEWVYGHWDSEYMINTVIGRYSLHAEVAKKHGDTHDYNLSKSMENWLRNVVKPLILEKQKEQKSPEDKYQQELEATDRWQEGYEAEYNAASQPAEWSKKDKRMLNTIISEFEAMSNNCETVLEKNLCAEKVTWLKSLPERFNFQPKQEWSKEEKGILLECISALQNSSNWLLADKLSSLRPQPKAEWSENDEQYLLICKNALHKYQRSDQWDANIISNWLEERLKSLHPQAQKLEYWTEEDERKYQCIRSILLTDVDKKVGSWKYSEILEWYEKRGIGRYTNFTPHWKPSEEQMRGLKFFLDFHRSQRNAGTTNWRGYDAVESLYEQLKKLR